MASQHSITPITLLRAEYKAPKGSKTFTHTLPSADVTSTTEKSAYLSVLRRLVVQTQEDINTFITAKMEEDKAVTSIPGMKADEKKAEENYGEEVDEEDD